MFVCGPSGRVTASSAANQLHFRHPRSYGRYLHSTWQLAVGFCVGAKLGLEERVPPIYKIRRWKTAHLARHEE